MQTQDQSRRILLNEIESKRLLHEAGIPVIPTRLARTQKEAVAFSREINFPVALKIVSPDISHKSDIGGVRLNLTSISQVSRAYSDIIHSAKNSLPSARIEGVSVQKMAEPGIELIIGVTRDPQFGLAMMFGIGGILVEILKDVSFRLIPISKLDAEEMISEIKSCSLLKGYRGYKPVNLALLQEIMIKVSDFAISHPQLEELDINPLIASGDSLLAVDARIILRSY